MATQEKTRICAYCEGRINAHDSICSYCGEKSTLSEEQQNSSTFQFVPPYQTSLGKEFHQEEKELFQKKEPTKTEKKENHHSLLSPGMKTLIAMFSLCLGAQLLTWAFLIFFFSTKETLTLEWAHSFWWKFSVIGAPLFFLGYKSINKLRHLED